MADVQDLYNSNIISIYEWQIYKYARKIREKTIVYVGHIISKYVNSCSEHEYVGRTTSILLQDFSSSLMKLPRICVNITLTNYFNL